MSRELSSATSNITGMQTHQQRYFYNASSLNLNPGASQNNPYAYALDLDINNPNYANPEYLSSAANQSGPPYENMLNQDFP